jgi:hypothetical protein
MIGNYVGERHLCPPSGVNVAFAFKDCGKPRKISMYKPAEGIVNPRTHKVERYPLD